jgi:Cu/Ag efflux pump CusA
MWTSTSHAHWWTNALGEATDLIPPGVGTPTMAPVSTGLGEVYQYVLHPETGLRGQVQSQRAAQIQEWIVTRQLLGTPGVAEVNSFGGEVKQYEVSVDPKRLQSMGVTIAMCSPRWRATTRTPAALTSRSGPTATASGAKACSPRWTTSARWW